MTQTSRRVNLWLAKGEQLTRNALADFLCELDAAGAAGDTPVEIRTSFWTGACRGMFADPVTRGDPVPARTAAEDWDDLAAGTSARPPFPGGPADWYDRRPAREGPVDVFGDGPWDVAPVPRHVTPSMVRDGQWIPPTPKDGS